MNKELFLQNLANTPYLTKITKQVYLNNLKLVFNLFTLNELFTYPKQICRALVDKYSFSTAIRIIGSILSFIKYNPYLIKNYSQEMLLYRDIYFDLEFDLHRVEF